MISLKQSSEHIHVWLFTLAAKIQDSHESSDLGSICLVKNRKIRFGIQSPILDFRKETHP